MKFRNHWRGALILGLACLSTAAWATEPHRSAPRHSAHVAKASKKPALDHSGKARRGKASYYARKFHGRKMADGTRMDANANVAASKTLPLGTTAKVTNLENGKSATVEIRDRGPYVDGRIVDVSPKVADKLDMKEDGVTNVVVKPITVPQPDGHVKTGAGSGPD